MDVTLITLRLLHIVLGVFWAGTLIFNALYLIPAIRDAGPDGARVVAGLMRRRFLDVVPVVALITILSGVWLYWRNSAGFNAVYLRSAVGMTLGVGAAAAIIAFGIGAGVMRPAMLRAAALTQAGGDGPLAQAQALRIRAAAAGRLVAVLLTIAVAAMAVARYL